jgi:hypothetical protein
MEFINNEYQGCIDFLNDLSQTCYECFCECLKATDLDKKADLLKSLIECSEHAKLTTGFLARKSMHTKEMALISAHLARVTADLCAEFPNEHLNLTKTVCLETQQMIIETFDNDES